jgi:ABC-2 type transport system ATP-binding protein
LEDRVLHHQSETTNQQWTPANSELAHYNTETLSQPAPRHYMDTVVLESVSKTFRHRPALFNWMSSERAGESCALDKVSLSVPAGKILAILGPNGSGKTTTLKLVSTMLLPDSGRVLVAGADTQRNPGTVRKHVGFAVAAERSFFPRLTARENLDFFATLDDVPRRIRSDRVEISLESVSLLEAADALVMKFSSGMYQRLGIARALIKRPSVILLDEPTRSIDPGSAAHCWNLVRELPKHRSTVLLATHSFQEAAAVADYVAILSRGTVVAFRHVSGSTSVEDLRSSYFQATGETDEMASPVGREEQ